MDQIEIKFPAPKAPASRQLTIWQTEENIALRFSFRVPIFSEKKHMLKDWGLDHVCMSNLISAEDFAAPKTEAGLAYDANKLADMFKEMARARLIKRLGLTEKEAEMVQFRGINVGRHLAGTKMDVGDPRWI